jgi:hypothetical protein
MASTEVSAKDYELNLDGNIHQLVEDLKQKRYRAKLVLRRYIPKGDGKFRPLGDTGHAGQTATFDEWMKREHPNNPWARYADDGVVHCRTQKEAESLLIDLGERFKQCKLELNTEKTRIVYCKDDDRRGNYPETSFDFLGYTFRPRRSKNRWGKCFINFSPAVSNAALSVRSKNWKMPNVFMQCWENAWGNSD